MAAEDSILIVAAHPDDEVIGAGIKLSRLKDRSGVTIVHLTDGSPRSLPDAENAGFSSRDEYAQERRQELLQAMALIGLSPAHCIALDAIDQESFLHLGELTRQVESIFERLRPSAVYTHPYEGGHPDHDSAAFCVQEAVSRVPARERPARMEFTSYHLGLDGAMQTGRFLPSQWVAAEEVLVFTPAERELKRRLLAAFPSQHNVLSAFTVDEERFRQAPHYDFSQPPHAGDLFYERMGWNTGRQWRAMACEALVSK